MGSQGKGTHLLAPMSKKAALRAAFFILRLVLNSGSDGEGRRTNSRSSWSGDRYLSSDCTGWNQRIDLLIVDHGIAGGCDTAKRDVCCASEACPCDRDGCSNRSASWTEGLHHRHDCECSSTCRHSSRSCDEDLCARLSTRWNSCCHLGIGNDGEYRRS